MLVIGSVSRSITVLSTSVPSPSVTSRACLPVRLAISRTRRGIRWKTAFTGWARMAVTLSWISRVSCSRPSRPTRTLEALEKPASITFWASMAWLITSSPTRSIRRSTRSRSTRIVVGAPGGPFEPPSEPDPEPIVRGPAPRASGSTKSGRPRSVGWASASSAWMRSFASPSPDSSPSTAVIERSQSPSTNSNTSSSSSGECSVRMITVQAA